MINTIKSYSHTSTGETTHALHEYSIHSSEKNQRRSELKYSVQSPTMKSPLYLTENFAKWLIASYALALACRPSLSQKKTKKKKKSQQHNQMATQTCEVI